MHNPSRLIGLLVLLLLPCTSPAASTTTLPSGMRVHLDPDPGEHLVRVRMYYAAGRAADSDSLAGLAHFAEHLLCEGRPAGIPGGFRVRAALNTVFFNAYTGSAVMRFESECLPAFLPRILEVERARMGDLGLDDAVFVREKAVVQEELAFRRRLGSGREHTETLLHACYRGHPFGEDVGGSPETLAHVTPADFARFQGEFIRPDHAVLVVDGPFDPETTAAVIDSIFGGFPDAPPASLDVPGLPPVASGQVVDDSSDFTGVRVSIGFRIPLTDSRRAVLTSSLPRLLDMPSSRMTVHSFPGEAVIGLHTHFDYSRPPKNRQLEFGYIYHRFDPDQSAQRAMAYLWERLDKQVAALRDTAVLAERRILARAGRRRFDLGSALVSGNRVPGSAETDSILAALTFDELAAFVDSFLAPGRATVGVTHGSDSERSQAIEMAGRAERPDSMDVADPLDSLTAADIAPVLAAYRDADLRTATVVSLDGGIPFVYLETPDAARVRLGGTRVLPPLKVQRTGDKPGIAQLYSIVVGYDDRQRRRPNDTDYRPRKLPYGLDIRLFPGSFRYRTGGPADRCGKIASLLVRRLDSESFNQEMWFRLIESGSGMLADISADPEAVADGWRRAQVLGDDFSEQGYYRPDPAVTGKIKYKDLVKLHKKVAGKTGQTVLYGTGGAPAADVIAACREAFADRDGFEECPAKAPDAPALDAVKGKVVPDLTRGDVLLTLAFPLDGRDLRLRGDQALLAEALMTQTIQSELRVRQGLTYTASATARTLGGCTVCEIDVTCRPGQAPAVLQAVREILQRIGENGFTADQIARARLMLTGRLIRSFHDPAGGFSMLGRLASLGMVSANPVADIAGLDDDSVGALAQAAFPPRFAFTAVGPMFEEDLDQFTAED